ncbi:MAG: N-acetyltransferase [Frankiales bacterium]|nr:N-acetyltransferase [Frankiales bacterium]
MRLTLVVVVDLAAGAVPVFHAYEAGVLPLLERHGGRLERRLRTDDALTEVHVLSFASQEGYASYLADEERQAHRALLDGAQLVQRVLQVQDVQP